MIDPNHAYTLHSTYSGPGCAHCGKDSAAHTPEYWLLNGAKVEPVTLKRIGENHDT